MSWSARTQDGGCQSDDVIIHAPSPSVTDRVEERRSSSTRSKYRGSFPSSAGIVLVSALVLVNSFAKSVEETLVELVVALELVVEVVDSLVSLLAEKAVELSGLVLVRYRRDLVHMEVDQSLIGPLVE